MRRARHLPPLLLALATLGGCATASLEMPQGFSADAERYPVSGLSPRRHAEPVRFGPYSALEMQEGARFGWSIPLGIASLDSLQQRWAYTELALNQPPVESQCQGRARSLRRGGGGNSLKLDLGALDGPLLACGFRIDDEDVLGLQLHRSGHRISGRLEGSEGQYEVRSLHGLQGTRIRSGTPTGYALTQDGRIVLVVDRVNAGSVAMAPGLDERQRMALAATATALLLFDPDFGED